MPAHPAASGVPVVTVYSTRRGLALSALAPTSLLLLGGAALLDGGWRLFPAFLALTGAVLALVVLFDVPRRAEFDLDGVVRVCWLRRQRLEWSRLVAIERSRPTTLSVVGNATRRRGEGPARVSGGLVARGAGKRRWLLSDRVEGREEHDRIVALLDRSGVPVMMRAQRPHPDATPSDLYRRR